MEKCRDRAGSGVSYAQPLANYCAHTIPLVPLPAPCRAWFGDHRESHSTPHRPRTKRSKLATSSMNERTDFRGRGGGGQGGEKNDFSMNGSSAWSSVLQCFRWYVVGQGFCMAKIVFNRSTCCRDSKLIPVASLDASRPCNERKGVTGQRGFL